MKLRNIMLVVGVSGLILSGCAHKSQNGTTGASSDTDAQSYGAQQNAGYTGGVKRNEYGQIVNPMTAPTNQTYYFDYDSNALNSSDNQAVNIQADYLAAHPKAKIRLEGNTDNRGSREYNVGLGWRRDQSVAKVLEQHGVSADQIEMVSYGKEHPVANGNDENAWRLNRRVELVYKVTE